jgi:hypothetical protein
VADFELYKDPRTEQQQRTIAVQEFGVWFAGFVRTAVFDDHYADLRRGRPV